MSSPGTVILLNGASSSGKTSLAKALQRLFEEPYLYASADTFIFMLPGPGRYLAFDLPDGGANYPGFHLTTVDDDGHPSLVIHAGPVARRVIWGMHAAIAALARAGNNVIFDEVLYDPAYLGHLLDEFQGLDVFFVGLRCPLVVLEQRERARDNRVLGHARGHYALVHTHNLYDIDLDTSQHSPEQCAERIKQHIESGAPPQAFDHLRAQRANA